ncbi:MAG: hypothetical protein WB290_08135 [Smithella sp.]
MFSSRIKGVDDTLKTSEERSDYADNRAEKLTLLVVSTVSARHNQKCGIMNIMPISA